MPKAERSIVKADLSALKGLTKVGYLPPKAMTHEQWADAGRKLAIVHGCILWWVGDWLAFGERAKYGEVYAEAMELFGYEYGTLANACGTSKRVEFSRRRENLTWSHHCEIAKLEPKAQSRWLKLAEKHKWTREELRKQIREANQDKHPTEFVDCDPLDSLPADHFGCIYVDPPWPYDNQGTRAATSNHYPTMTIDDLCRLPVEERASEEAHLWLWTTNGFLRESFAVMEAWGFDYKSVLVWVKPQMGIGNYLRVSHEFLMIATRGGLTGRSTSQRSVIEHDRLGHSQKPEAFRKAVEAVSPGPYLELFGRKRVEGWTVWGNQVEGTLV